MSGERSIALVTALVAGWLLCTPARAIELRSDLSLLGQVRESPTTLETDSPTDLYGDMGLSGLPSNSNFDTYFRLSHDFANNQGPTDFYAGYFHVPAPGLDVTLGRQFLNEGPGGVFVADGGRVRMDPGGPFSFTVFAGAPRYFEPTYSSPLQSQTETIFGGNMRTTHLKHGYFSLGYFEQERENRVIRQLFTATAAHSFTTLPGLPNFYGSAAFDAKRQNIDQITAGVDAFLANPRLSLNFEGGYYKPQNQGEVVNPNLDLQENAIFELFSVSQMLQFRGGARYALTHNLSAFGDYSYQRYEQTDSSYVNGNIGSVGLRWLPGGDGLEVVRLEYYVVDSAGGNLNGGRFSYENRVYRRILFRTKVDVGYYEKDNNLYDTPVSTLLGLGYNWAPGVFGELYMEANRNERLNEDFRFGFLITYKFDQQVKRPAHKQEAS